MNRLDGYAGKILHIDLTAGKWSLEALDEEDARLYLGGAGLSAKILYSGMPQGADPLGPENLMVFATGPLTGTGAPGSGSIDLCFKSPLTGIWAESRSGSDFGGMLRKAGFDAMVISGASEKPVCLVVDGNEIALRPARELAGRPVSERVRVLKDAIGADFEMAVIGPAGENKVRYATVMFGNEGSRAAGRSGGGAVMGAKNLLAVAVRGKASVPVADEGAFRETVKRVTKRLVDDPSNAVWAKEGTTGELARADKSGDWPTKNWAANSWGKGPELFDHFQKKNFIEARGCYTGCVLRCGRVAQVTEGPWKTPVHEGCEYETMSTFTSYLLNEDVDAAVHASWVCNEMGIDTISAGSVIAFAMDCFEQGLIDPSDNAGRTLEWGDMEGALDLLKRIVHRDGLGDLLAEGSREAAKRIGGGAEKLAVHVKGLEGPAHDPRSGKALGLSYGVGNTGMNHIHPIEGMAWDAGKADFGLLPYGLPDPADIDRWDEPGKGEAVKILHDFGMLPDMLGICKFYAYSGVTVDDMAEMMTALTGRTVTGKDLLKAGSRTYTLQRLFNVREGVTRADDVLPEKVLKQPAFGYYSEEPACVTKRYGEMVDEYYAARGWDCEGRPTKETLEHLGLEWTLSS
jgi:aldehyde:ferredoxin oxidoreductase